MVASIIGAFTVRTSDSTAIKDLLEKALHQGTNLAAAITTVGTFVLGYVFFDGQTASTSGGACPSRSSAACSSATPSARSPSSGPRTTTAPVKQIARQSETGAGHDDPVGHLLGHDVGGRLGAS